MPINVMSLLVHVGADTSEAKTKLGELGTSARQTGSLFGAIGLSATGGSALIVEGLNLAREAFTGFIDAAKEGQGVTTQLNTVLQSTHGAAGETAEAATALALGLSRVTPYSKDANLATENLLLTFTNIKSNVFPQATETVLNMATALGVDAKNAAIQVGKALQDPITGATALRRVGVALTEQQREQIKAFVASGNVQAAQGVILKELTTEFGNSARAAGQTYAGQLAIAKNRSEEFKQTIGDALLPVLITGQKIFNEIANQLVDNLTPYIEQAGAAMSAFAKGPMQQMGNVALFLIKNFEQWKPILIGIGVAILVGLIPAMVAWIATTIAATVANIALAAAVIAANAPLIAIAIAIGALVALVIYAYQHWTIFRTVVNTVRDSLVALWQNIQVGLSQFMTFWNAAWPYIQQVLVIAWNAIRGEVQIAWAFISGLIQVGLNLLQGNWRGAWQAILNMLVGIWDGMNTATSGALNRMVGAIVGKAGAFLDGLTRPFRDAWGWLTTNPASPFVAMAGLLNGLVSTVIGAAGSMFNALKAPFNALLNWLINDPHSPIKWLVDTVHNFQGLFGGGGGGAARGPGPAGAHGFGRPMTPGSYHISRGWIPGVHDGVDMAAPIGTPIFASASGTVVLDSPDRYGANRIAINDGDGWGTFYAHMSRNLVHSGQYVQRGQEIGLVGSTGFSTGPHLHFGLYHPMYHTINAAGIVPYAQGGWLTEPTIGVGLRTGRMVSMAESGNEYVTPESQMTGRSAPYIGTLVIQPQQAQITAEDIATIARRETLRWWG